MVHALSVGSVVFFLLLDIVTLVLKTAKIFRSPDYEYGIHFIGAFFLG